MPGFDFYRRTDKEMFKKWVRDVFFVHYRENSHKDAHKRAFHPKNIDNLNVPSQQDFYSVVEEDLENSNDTNEKNNNSLPEAQYRMGLCYEYGEGVKQDKEEAVKMYRKAAARNEVAAQYNLGCCYANGEGVKQDMLKAAQCFYKAARQGDKDAKDALRRVLDHDDIDE